MLPNKCSLITTLEVYFEWLPHKLYWGWADQRCRSCSKQIRVNKSDKSWLLKTSPDGRMHCFKVLEPYFSCFQNTFLKIQALHVAKMSILSFLAEKMAVKVEKARFRCSVPPSDFPKSNGDPVYSLTEWLTHSFFETSLIWLSLLKMSKTKLTDVEKSVDYKLVTTEHFKLILIMLRFSCLASMGAVFETMFLIQPSKWSKNSLIDVET